MMCRLLFCLCWLFLAADSYSHAQHTQKDYCKQTIGPVEVANSTENILNYSALWLDIATNNAEQARKNLGRWLIENADTLSEHLDNNPCHLPPQTLNDIYKPLRIIAAIHQHSPVPNIDKHPHLVALLKKAIDNNPKDYQQLLQRTKNWGKNYQ